MKKLLLILFYAFTCLFTSAAGKMTANDVLHITAKKIVTSNGLSAEYTISGKKIGHHKGVIKCSGKKFVISGNNISTWYDGNNMWNYNVESNEVTLVNPTNDELLLTNPYIIVSNYKNNYTARLVKSKIRGAYCIELFPLHKSGISKLYMYVSQKNYLPVRIDAFGSNNLATTIIVSNCKLNQKFANSTFVFPHNKYRKAKIIDLR